MVKEFMAKAASAPKEPKKKKGRGKKAPVKKPRVKKPPVKTAPVKEAPGAKTAPVKKAEHILKGKVANKKAGPVKKPSGEEKEKTWDALKYDPTLEVRASEIWLRNVVH